MGEARDAVLANFDVDEQGVIRSPGKFEGEPLYSAYYYDMMMNGFGDDYYVPEDDRIYTVFVPGDEEVAEFPELADIVGVIGFETDQGFFHVESYDDTEANQFNMTVTAIAESAGEE